MRTMDFEKHLKFMARAVMDAYWFLAARQIHVFCSLSS